MFNEILTSLKSYLYDRAVSPLMGSFIVSWVLFNYKFILILLSESPVVQKFAMIQTFIFSTNVDIFLCGFLYPLLISLVYIYVYPHPAKWVFTYTRKRQVEINEIRKNIEQETLLSVKDSQEIRRKIYELEDLHQNEVHKKNTEIDALKAELRDLSIDSSSTLSTSKIPEDKNEKKSELNEKLDEGHYQILKIIDDIQTSLFESDIQESSNAGKSTIRHLLDELVQMNLLNQEYDEHSNKNAYTLTQKGNSQLHLHKKGIT